MWLLLAVLLIQAPVSAQSISAQPIPVRSISAETITAQSVNTLSMDAQPADVQSPSAADDCDEMARDASSATTLFEQPITYTTAAAARSGATTSAGLAADADDAVRVTELSVADLPGAPFVQPGKQARSMTVSVRELQMESRANRELWMGLGIASHGAATFDAWSSRHAITTAGAHELNPMLRPFAGNASLYLAIQVSPTVMDYLAKKMMYNRHAWMRRVWWVPQSAGLASSLFSGAHNLSMRAPVN